jgi:hypothetical protein
MARTNIAGQNPAGPFPAGATVGAGALDLVWTAADTVNNNEFPFTGRDILLVQNTDSASHNLTITSSPDEHGRTADVTSYAVAAGKISAFSFRQGAAGWQQNDGHVYFAGDNALLKFAVITLPN